jgi:hypothetical protein
MDDKAVLQMEFTMVTLLFDHGGAMAGMSKIKKPAHQHRLWFFDRYDTPIQGRFRK